jgi:hypothetical protein
MSYCLFDLLFVQVPGVGEHRAIVPGKKKKVQDEFKYFPAPPSTTLLFFGKYKGKYTEKKNRK